MGTMILMEPTRLMLSKTDDKVGGGAGKEQAGCSDHAFWTTPMSSSTSFVINLMAIFSFQF